MSLSAIKKLKLSWLTLGCLSVFLSACSSSPPVRYYQLKPLEMSVMSTVQHDAGPSATITIGPIRMPGYLEREQIVSRASGGEVIINDYARWAQPLEHSIHSVLATNSEALMSNVSVVSYIDNPQHDSDYAVVGSISRFDSDASGTIVLESQWMLVDKRRRPVLPLQRLRYQSVVANTASPSAIAAAMNDTLWQFANDIADGFAQLPNKAGRS